MIPNNVGLTQRSSLQFGLRVGGHRAPAQIRSSDPSELLLIYNYYIYNL